jgi:hypothetical protein
MQAGEVTKEKDVDRCHRREEGRRRAQGQIKQVERRVEEESAGRQRRREGRR